MELTIWRTWGQKKSRTKITVEGLKNSEKWKAVPFYWDGSNKDSWVPLSNSAVQLKVRTAMTNDIAGVRVLTEVLDLLFDKENEYADWPTESNELWMTRKLKGVDVNLSWCAN